MPRKAAAARQGGGSSKGKKRKPDFDSDISSSGHEGSAMDEDAHDSEAGLEPLRRPGRGASGNGAAAAKRQRRVVTATAKKAAAYDEDEESMFMSEESSGSPDPRRPMDSNDTHCRACGKDSDSSKLLCCEGCPAVYHISCLDPPLPRIPRGDWFCPSCTGLYRLQDVERILDVRQPGQQQQEHKHPGQHAAGADVAAEQQQQQQQQQQQAQQGQQAQEREFFIKWKERSFMHCSWVRESDMQAGAKLFQPLRQKMKKFEASLAAEAAEHAEEVESGELVHGVNPLWLQVDRVLAQHTNEDGALDYLVKWKDLDYDKASWERAEDLAQFQAEIQRFHSLRPIAADARARARAAANAAATAAHPSKRMKLEHGKPGESAAKAGDAGEHEQPQRGRQRAQQEDATGAGQQRGAGSRKFEATPAFLAGGQLHPYQLEGLNWLYHSHKRGENVILGDEMGLGKTVQTVAFLAALHEVDFCELPHLVVVPLSTIRNWEREFGLWAPQLNVVSLLGNQEARTNILQHELFMPPVNGQRERLQERVKFHVLLTSYEMVGRELTQLAKLQFDVLAVDEGHRLRNKESRLFQDLNRLQLRHRLLLTGTPLQNNIGELFMLLHFLDAAKFSSQEEFATAFSDLSHQEQVEELHGMLAPHLLRRLKKDVLKNLPKKMEQIVRVELSTEQRDLYKSLLTKNFKVLMAGKREGTVRLKNLMMELRKCCNHPYLFSNGGPPESMPDQQAALQALISRSGKLELLDKMMGRLLGAGHRVLVYSQFTRTLDILEDWLLYRQWGYLRIDGEVAGSERQKRVDAFNNQPDKYSVFLLSTRAGGLGLNLATADTVIIYDSDWNPHNDLQAQARAHRMGQKRPVMTYRLVTRATIEERMMQKAKNKMVLERLVVGAGANAKLEQAALDDILRYGAQELFADDPSAVASTTDQQKPDAADGDGAGAGEAAAAAAAAAAAVDGAAAAAAKEREERAARLRIVWDDAAIERLLDRSVLLQQKAEAEEDEEGDQGFMKAFKVANFEMVEDDQDASTSDGAAEAAAAATAAATADAAPPATDFWGGLLKSRYESMQTAELAQMGRGRRARTDVRYEGQAELSADDSSDWEAAATAASSDSDGDETLEEEKPSERKRGRRAEGGARRVRSITSPQPPPRQQGSVASPLMEGKGSTLKVLGFNQKERFTFITTLMQFGLHTEESDQNITWQHFQKKLPNKTLNQIYAYCRLLMCHIEEVSPGDGQQPQSRRAITSANTGPAGPPRQSAHCPPAGEPTFKDGVPKCATLGDYRAADVLCRIGQLHAIAQKLQAFNAEKTAAAKAAAATAVENADVAPIDDDSFRVGDDGRWRRLRAGLVAWRPRHDFMLLRGLLKHGNGKWAPIIHDEALGIKAALRTELKLPMDYDEAGGAPAAAAAAQATTAAADAGTAAGAAAAGAGAAAGDAAAVAAVAAGAGDMEVIDLAGDQAVGARGSSVEPDAGAASGGAAVDSSRAAHHAMSFRSMVAKEKQWLMRRVAALFEALQSEKQPAAQQQGADKGAKQAQAGAPRQQQQQHQQHQHKQATAQAQLLAAHQQQQRLQQQQAAAQRAKDAQATHVQQQAAQLMQHLQAQQRLQQQQGALRAQLLAQQAAALAARVNTTQPHAQPSTAAQQLAETCLGLPASLPSAATSKEMREWQAQVLASYNAMCDKVRQVRADTAAASQQMHTGRSTLQVMAGAAERFRRQLTQLGAMAAEQRQQLVNRPGLKEAVDAVMATQGTAAAPAAAAGTSRGAAPAAPAPQQQQQQQRAVVTGVAPAYAMANSLLAALQQQQQQQQHLRQRPGTAGVAAPAPVAAQQGGVAPTLLVAPAAVLAAQQQAGAVQREHHAVLSPASHPAGVNGQPAHVGALQWQALQQSRQAQQQAAIMMVAAQQQQQQQRQQQPAPQQQRQPPKGAPQGKQPAPEVITLID